MIELRVAPNCPGCLKPVGAQHQGGGFTKV